MEKPFYKNEEIEDFIDLHFYHPLGFFFAKLAYKLGLSPNIVSVISMIVGVIGAFLLFYPHYDILGVLLIIFASILDSSDGQLARMTKNSSKLGRIIDGLVGYVIFTVAYIVIAYRYFPIYGYKIYILMFAAGIFTIIHSSVYDFYRTVYAKIASGDLKFVVENYETKRDFFHRMYSVYNSYQKFFVKKHLEILRKLFKLHGKLTDREIDLYRKKMLKNIQFINLLGDNWRINGLLIFALISRLDIYFIYIIVFLNFVFILVYIRQNKINMELMNELEVMRNES